MRVLCFAERGLVVALVALGCQKALLSVEAQECRASVSSCTSPRAQKELAQWLDQLAPQLREKGVYQLLATTKPRSKEQELILPAVELSAHVLRKHPEELAFQLQGRLRSWYKRYPRLRVVEQLPSRQPVHLRPRWPSLDQAGGPLVRTLQGHEGWICCVAISPDGRYVISGSSDNTLKIWELSTGRLLATFSLDDTVHFCCFSRDGKYLAAGEGTGSVHLFEFLPQEKSNAACAGSSTSASINASSRKPGTLSSLEPRGSREGIAVSEGRCFHCRSFRK